MSDKASEPRFQARLEAESQELEISIRTTASLRFQLWCELRRILKLQPALPFSTGFANARAAELASEAARHFKQPGGEHSSASRRDFSSLVRHQVKQAVLSALRGDGLRDDQRKQVEAEFSRKLEDLPDELRDASLESALRSADWATAASLVSAGSLAGLGVAVEVAGFGAYIAAAKASAIIPFLGGKTAVSILAVVANPLFIIPVVGAGFLMTGKWLKGRALRPPASAAVVQLAVLGLAAGSKGLQGSLDGLKSLQEADCGRKLWSVRQDVWRHSGGFPRTPGKPDVDLPSIAETGLGDKLMSILHPDRERSGPVALAAAGMTTAELLFAAAAIDPRVVAAADFSCAEDLSGIFRFGAFADRIGSLEGVSRAGAESGLRGYLAEMIVATRLRGHEVSLPDAPNRPGVDLYVDGNPFQVKCYSESYSGISALREHFEKGITDVSAQRHNWRILFSDSGCNWPVFSL